MANEIASLLKESSYRIRNRYDGLVDRAKEDPGTSGDNGEEIWAGILREWLPPMFDVKTKARLITKSGEASPQIDLVVLSPFYPTVLRDQTYFLLSGVVAAFECKNTLRSTHFDKFFKNCRSLAAFQPPQQERLDDEMSPPIIYGMLAHSHVWKRPKSKPYENIKRCLSEQYSSSTLTSPRQVPSLLCVADVAAWNRVTFGFNYKAVGTKSGNRIPTKFWFGIRSALYSYLDGHSGCPPTQDYDPLNLFLYALYRELGVQFPQVLPIASDLINQSTSELAGSFNFSVLRSLPDSSVSQGARSTMEQAIRSGHTEMLKSCVFPNVY